MIYVITRIELFFVTYNKHAYSFIFSRTCFSHHLFHCLDEPRGRQVGQILFGSQQIFFDRTVTKAVLSFLARLQTQYRGVKRFDL